ncbi:hypothetical protein [Streptomyces sp. NRRL WC-3742]|uniref:hypothetical protein n=1 Tax=Streptomyces sp. NRRL WC-3742 TaxID=1463934 RepID=UPI0004C7B866|nr:hypothetical protein [Streptomyces sp. NRRL WC-3742]
MGKSNGPGVGRWLLHGALTLAGLAVVALSFLRYDALYEDDRAVLTAPRCGTPAAAQHADCVRLESAAVTGKDVKDDGSTRYEVTVRRETAGEKTFETSESFHSAVHTGDSVELRIWKGRVAELAFRERSTRPENVPLLAMIWVGLLAAGGTALLVAGVARPPYAWVVPVAVAVLYSPGVWYIGIRLLSARLPAVVTLGVPALVWLAITAFAVVLVRD